MGFFLLVEFPDAMVFSRSESNIGSPRISELQSAYLRSFCGQKSVAHQETCVYPHWYGRRNLNRRPSLS